ncbi:MAG: glutamate synthase, partial [Thermoplasmata archaeon]
MDGPADAPRPGEFRGVAGALRPAALRGGDPLRDAVQRILTARKDLIVGLPPGLKKREAEGGCGVLGLASTKPIAGRHLFPAMRQMHNRGNGKGGGIAAVGLDPKQMGVSPEVLARDYLLLVAYLDPSCREEVEGAYIQGPFEVDHAEALPTRKPKEVPGLEVRPPEVVRYFVRPREDRLRTFAEETGLEDLPRGDLEDEFVYRNSYRLNTAFYASLGEQRAFVLSHGKDLMVLKIVGYAEQVVQFYRLEEVTAHVWIGHQRYPTKGKVWHPGGAHPFVGLHEALVHNGDFANYARVTKYLRQRNIVPLFLTDTEVSVLLFDLLRRTYRYPLEYVIEAMAPTTERDFAMLPEEKQEAYRRIQAAHIHGSPDGPWFFIVARREPEGEMQLLGITDTSMLRPQVFALQQGEVSLGMVASEKQAIDAFLRSVNEEDPRIWRVADRYWNARGGSYTNGGSFIFSLRRTDQGLELGCTDKFGASVEVSDAPLAATVATNGGTDIDLAGDDPGEVATQAMGRFRSGAPDEALALVHGLLKRADRSAGEWTRALEVLTRLLDRPYPLEGWRRSRARAEIGDALETLLDAGPPDARKAYVKVGWEGRDRLEPPARPDATLIVDLAGFPGEDEESGSRFLVEAYQLGWRRILTFRNRGQRFVGCGLGPDSTAEIHAYGSSGDYLASGLDGSEVHVHGSAQDQVAQIMKAGRLVVHGDVGQTFMYGAKGGEAYVLGNAAGRPLINAVGRPRVVINGTALDYLAESFMAGDPHKGGGFVIVNGLHVDQAG